MTSRREFLLTAAAGLGASARRPVWAAGQAPAVKTVLKAPVGLQLYSLRDAFKKNGVPATLSVVRALGIREIESAGLYGLPAAEVRAAFDKADLVCRTCHMGIERLRDDMAGAFAEVKALGGSWIVCPYIPHEKPFTKAKALAAVDVFNKVARAAQGEGLKFAYHCHGFEFVPEGAGTVFDAMVEAADPTLVGFEIDVFWAQAGGANPVELITKLKGRVPFLHVKDMRKGLVFERGSSGAPGDTNVPLGTGQIDWPAVFRATEQGSPVAYYIEDESPDPVPQIKQTLAYLAALKL
jgi:sugar phosphate isomerase/epimerase